MTRRVKTAPSETTVFEAAKAMARSRIGSLVLMSKGKPLGIVTEGDISRAVAAGVNAKSATLKSLIKRKLITATSDVRVEDAAKLMSTAGVKKLPVVESGKLIGIVTQTDIVASSFELVNTLKELVRARYKPGLRTLVASTVHQCLGTAFAAVPPLRRQAFFSAQRLITKVHAHSLAKACRFWE